MLLSLLPTYERAVIKSHRAKESELEAGSSGAAVVVIGIGIIVVVKIEAGNIKWKKDGVLRAGIEAGLRRGRE